jgi:hypothetical protein
MGKRSCGRGPGGRSPLKPLDPSLFFMCLYPDPRGKESRRAASIRIQPSPAAEKNSSIRTDREDSIPEGAPRLAESADSMPKPSSPGAPEFHLGIPRDSRRALRQFVPGPAPFARRGRAGPFFPGVSCLVSRFLRMQLPLTPPSDSDTISREAGQPSSCSPCRHTAASDALRVDALAMERPPEVPILHPFSSFQSEFDHHEVVQELPCG